jgi:SAM-dependent methyltransferase
VIDVARFGLPPAPARILDVGAAAGGNSVALRDAGYDVTAIEIQPGLAAEASARGVRICVGDGTRLPVHDAAFDGALVVEVFEHVPDPDLLVDELARVVRADGRVCVALPTAYTERVFRRLHPRYAQNAGHVRSYERADVARLLERKGFAIAEVRTDNLIPAISWFFHALLRSDSDDTGAILQHQWVDRVLRVVVGGWRRIPLLRRTYHWLDGRVGKSWYFVGVRR